MIGAGSKIRLMLALLAAWFVANFGSQLQAGVIMVSDSGQIETPNVIDEIDRSSGFSMGIGGTGTSSDVPVRSSEGDDDRSRSTEWSSSLRLQKYFVYCRVESRGSPGGVGAEPPDGSGSTSGNLSECNRSTSKSCLIQLAGYLASLKSGTLYLPPCPLGIFRPPRSAVFAQYRVGAA